MSYASTVLADAPFSYYHLNETSGTAAADSSGNAHTATYTGGFTLNQTGFIGDTGAAAVTLNGSTGYVSCPSTGVPIGNAPFTIELWVKLNASGTTQLLMGWGTNTTHEEPNLYVNSSGSLIMSSWSTDTTVQALTVGTWYHLALTWDGTTLTCYVNGASKATSTPGAIATPASPAFTIGRNPNPSEFFANITVQEVAGYATTLSAARVLAHYNAGLTISAVMGGTVGGLVATPTPAAQASMGGTSAGLVANVGRYSRGIADSGPEFGGTFPGTYGVDYHYDGLGSLQYFASRGHKIIRLPFSWERIQPTRNAALDPTELGRLTTYLSNAAAAGVKVILDVHNFARYITPTGTTLVLYTDFPDTDLSDLWTRLSTAFKGNPAIYAYELMNEPHDLPSQTFPFVASQTVADFDTAGLTITNWSTNGGEAGTYALSTVQAHDGTHALGFTPSAWAASGFDDVRLWDRQNTYTYDGTNGTLSVWVYIPSTAGTSLHGHLELANSGGNDSSATVSIPANTWTELTHTPAVGKWTGNQGIIVQLEAWSAAGGAPTFYVDGIQLGTKPADTTGNLRWQTTSQSVLNAIRANNDTTLVYVDGYQFASATSWTTNHPNGPWLTDSANNIRYIAHHYCGTNQSGQFNTYTQENSDAIGRGYTSLADQAVKRLKTFTNWLRAYAVQGGVTEIAWRGDEETTQWNAVGEAMYEELDAANCDVTYWGAGEWWPALASTMPAWYGVYTNGTGGGQAPVSVANPQAPVIEVHATTATIQTTPTATVTRIAGASGVVTHL